MPYWMTTPLGEMYCRLYNVSMVTYTAASGSTEADNAVLDDDPTGRYVLQTVQCQYAHLYRSQWQHRS